MRGESSLYFWPAWREAWTCPHMSVPLYISLIARNITNIFFFKTPGTPFNFCRSYRVGKHKHMGILTSLQVHVQNTANTCLCMHQYWSPYSNYFRNLSWISETKTLKFVPTPKTHSALPKLPRRKRITIIFDKLMEKYRERVKILKQLWIF